MKWFVDASHDNCTGHSSGLMTMRQVAIISFSQKQKLNTKSSTKAELIAVDDGMASII